MYALLGGLNGRSAGCYPDVETLMVTVVIIDQKTNESLAVSLPSDAAMLLGKNLLLAGQHVDGSSHLARPISDWTPIQEGVTGGNDDDPRAWEDTSILEG